MQLIKSMYARDKEDKHPGNYLFVSIENVNK